MVPGHDCSTGARLGKCCRRSGSNAVASARPRPAGACHQPAGRRRGSAATHHHHTVGDDSAASLSGSGNDRPGPAAGLPSVRTAASKPARAMRLQCPVRPGAGAQGPQPLRSVRQITQTRAATRQAVTVSRGHSGEHSTPTVTTEAGTDATGLRKSMHATAIRLHPVPGMQGEGKATSDRPMSAHA